MKNAGSDESKKCEGELLPPEVNYYQAASIELDIYGLGRTIQYLLSVTD